MAENVADVACPADGFCATPAAGGILTSARMVIATGHRDHLDRLNLPGIGAVCGKSVYPCPFCDGFEHSREALAIFGHGAIEHFVAMIRIWSQDLIVFANGEALDSKVQADLVANGAPVEEGKTADPQSANGRLSAVVLEDRREIARQSGFGLKRSHAPPPTSPNATVWFRMEKSPGQA